MTETGNESDGAQIGRASNSEAVNLQRQLKLGRDPHGVTRLTGQRKMAAAALPYVKLVLIGSTEKVARFVGDKDGEWLVQLVVTSDVEGTLRVMSRRTRDKIGVLFEAWTDAPADVAQALKASFDAKAIENERLWKEGTSLLMFEPEKALAALGALAAAAGVTFRDNAWYEGEVAKRAAQAARILGGRR